MQPITPAAENIPTIQPLVVRFPELDAVNCVEFSADGKTLPLESMGPSFTDPKVMAKYRDVIDWKSDDERHFYSEIQQPDGTWNRFMHGIHRRVK